MYDKKIKMLLLILNKRGIDVNHETKTSYSQNFDAMITSHTLKFWYKGVRTDKDGNPEEYKYCKTVEFHSAIGLLKYLVAVKDSKAKAGDDYVESD